MFTAPTVWLPRQHLSIDYFSPARLDDALALVTYVPRVGETSLTFHVDVVALADGRAAGLGCGGGGVRET